MAEDIWGHLDLWGVRGLERVVWRRCGGIWTLTAAIKGAQRGREADWAGSIPADLCRITWTSMIIELSNCSLVATTVWICFCLSFEPNFGTYSETSSISYDVAS